MAGLSEAAKKFMQRKQAEGAARQASGNFTKSFNLTGKNAIVEQGAEVTVRLLPHWSIAKVEGGKVVRNPEYKSGEDAIFVYAWEHWWDGDGGKVVHAWCPKTFDEQTECPVCEAAKVYVASSDETEKKYGKRIQRKEVYIFNAVIGRPRKLAEGKADIRILSVPFSVYNGITDIMTGGEDEEYARGNIGDHETGFDIKLKRPAKGGNERWAVQCSPKSTPLYDEAQKAAFAGWPGLIVNLDEMLKREMKSALELFKLFYGRDPEADEMNESMAAEAAAKQKEVAETVAGATEDAPEAQTEESAEAPIEDEFMSPSAAQAPAPRPSTPPTPQPPKVSGPKTGGRR